MATNKTETNEQRRQREDVARQAKYAAMQAARLEMFNKFAATIVAPDGFTMRYETETFSGWGTLNKVVLEKPDDMKIIFKDTGDGTVNFNTAQGWKTYDRRGIESSFYWIETKYGSGGKSTDTPLNAAEIIAAQIKRVEDRRPYYLTALQIPEVNATVQPDALEALKEKLRTKGEITFTPAGFGTGYIVHTKRPRQPFGVRRAGAELEKFLGITGLWISTMDCD